MVLSWEQCAVNGMPDPFTCTGQQRKGRLQFLASIDLYLCRVKIKEEGEAKKLSDKRAAQRWALVTTGKEAYEQPPPPWSIHFWVTAATLQHKAQEGGEGRIQRKRERRGPGKEL